MLLGSCATAGLAVGLFAAASAWAESPRTDAPRDGASPVVETTTSEPIEQVEIVDETATGEDVVAVDEPQATSEAPVTADAEDEALPGSEPEVEVETAAIPDPIAEQLALLMGPGTSGEDAPLADFYGSRDFAPAWVGVGGVTADGQALLDVLAGAAADGLYPDEYLDDPILNRLTVDDAATQAELDILLSDAFLRYGNDIMNGRFRQREATAALRDFESDMDLTQPLRYAVESGLVEETLHGLAPQHPQYQALRAALAEYRALAAAGGWVEIPETGSSLEQGTRGSAVSALRARLTVTGDYVVPAEGVADDLYYDAELAEAVKVFQERHGLLVDAVIGPRTLAALNASVGYRIEQLIVAMERWRWYPRDLGSKHVMVNVPAFMVRAVDGDEEPLEMRVVVGTQEHQTPVFNDRMEYAQINPYWNVPQSIADNEYLPALRDDPFHLLNQNIRILSGGQEINPVLVDWSSVGGRFPYSLRQEPGNGNALGRIKFMFPNGHAVYMHDTPSRHLFGRTTRAFSHGCIRLQDPLAMAGFVFNGRYTAEQVEEMIASGRTRDLILDETIPVYVAYFTAAVSDDGTVNFYRDLYGRDRVLIQAMDASAPVEPEQLAENTSADGLN